MDSNDPPDKHDTPTARVTDDTQSQSANQSDIITPIRPLGSASPTSSRYYRFKSLYQELKVRYAHQKEVLNDTLNENNKLKMEIMSLKRKSEKTQTDKMNLSAQTEIQEMVTTLVQTERPEFATSSVQTDNSVTVITSKPTLEKRVSDEKLFRLLPTASQKKRGCVNDDLCCDFDGCNKKGVDLIKCSACLKWVCEACNDIPIAKLKPLMNRCRTIYVLCKTCNDNLDAEHDVLDMSKTSHNMTGLLKSMEKMFDEKVQKLESKLEMTLDSKLEDKLKIVNDINDNLKVTKEAETSQKINYAKVLAVPKEIQKVITQTKNDEKIEKTEHEKRSANFIIHGAEEIGDNEDEIIANDKEYIHDILKKLDISAEVDSILRLGKLKPSYDRAMKICLRNKEDKIMVMENLRKLKGTEYLFGKISITDDYTKTERELIKQKVDEAKEKSKNDSTRIFKVRGTPKTGLTIIGFKRKKDETAWSQ